VILPSTWFRSIPLMKQFILKSTGRNVIWKPAVGGGGIGMKPWLTNLSGIRREKSCRYE
jgi:hypothetical protein